jgi:hypothetical protein
VDEHGNKKKWKSPALSNAAAALHNVQFDFDDDDYYDDDM